MRQLLGQGERLVAPLQGLVRIAKKPQGQGRIGEASHPGVMPVEEGMGAVLLGVVEGNALLQVRAGRGKLSQTEQGRPQRIVGLQEESRVLHALGQAQELLPQLARRLELRPHQIKHPQSPQHREELRGLPHLLAQLPRPGVGLFHFRGRIALGGHQRRAQGELQRQFLLGALGGVRQGLEQLQPLGEVS